MPTSELDPVRVGIALLVLLALCLLVLGLARVRVRADALVSTGRAVVQLLLVALVIALVFRHPEGAVAYLAVMLLAAAVTSVRRIGCGWWALPRVLLAIAAGALAALVPVVASGALELSAERVLPFAAQVLGGSMTACSLAGSRFTDEVHTHWGEVEARLSLGATPRAAVSDLARLAVARALVPSLDQTKNAGVVVLPGAFVGLLLGGASPWEAAQIQLLVLVGLLAAGSVSAVLLTRLLATSVGGTRPRQPAG